MRAYLLGLYGARLALLVACGAQEKPAPASVERPGPLPHFANLAIIDGGPLVGMHFEHFGVNPTVDTREQAESTFGLRADQASVGLAQVQLGLGTLPNRASVRVEDFVNALVPPRQTVDSKDLFAVDTELFPSPHRPGYDVLRISLTAKSAPIARRVFVVIDADAAHRDAVRRLVLRVANTLNPLDTIALVAGTGRVVLPLVRAGDGRIRAAIDTLRVDRGHGQAGVGAAARLAHGRGQIVYVSDGLAQYDQPTLNALLATAQTTTALGWTIVGLGRGPYDDPRLNQLTTASGGRYLYADPAVSLASSALVAQSTVAVNARAHVRFDAAAVTRYRLLGHERQAQADAAQRGSGARVMGGSTVTALWEVKRVAGAKSLGHMMIQANDTHGIPVRRTVALTVDARPSFEAASVFSRQAIIAAALAEKLRSAYWVRGVDYAALRGRLNAIPARARDPILDRMLTQTQALDTRGDTYADRGPVAKMGFDHVPIVRR